MNRIWAWLGTVLCLSLIAACTTVKPARLFAPEQFGMTCVEEALCIEDVSRADEAKRLRDDAFRFVSANLGPMENMPRMLFCATKACFAQFGNPEVAALYFWGIERILINDIGWSDHIVTHEMIHHWQDEHFGARRGALAMPRWYIEGMAYSLSNDPRRPLPREDIEAFRAEFETWVAAGNDWRVPPK